MEYSHPNDPFLKVFFVNETNKAGIQVPLVIKISCNVGSTLRFNGIKNGFCAVADNQDFFIFVTIHVIQERPPGKPQVCLPIRKFINCYLTFPCEEAGNGCIPDRRITGYLDSNQLVQFFRKK